MIFIDTHSHMYLSDFNDDIDEVLERCRQQYVQKIILPNIDAQSIESMHALCDKYPETFYPVLGLHPTYVKDEFSNELKHILQHFDAEKHIGIGEIGIDLYWDKTHIAQQKEAFGQQLDFAQQHNLPVIIHARESFDEIFEVLEALNYPTYKGVLHAFTGTAHEAERAIEMGFYLGIGGILTYKKSTLPASIQNIPIEKMVLETDSPYLPPVPHRGKRNESSYIPLVAAKMAEIKNVSLQHVANITTQNATDIFGL